VQNNAVPLLDEELSGHSAEAVGRTCDENAGHDLLPQSELLRIACYAALKLAQAAVFRNMSEPELRKFESLGNVFELVKLEGKGVRISEELIVAAQTQPVEAFRQMTGSGKKASVGAVVDSSDAARVLQSIVDILKTAEPDALLMFHEVLQNAMLQAGGNATDGVDCINAACVHQWRQEGLPELPLSRKLSQEDHRSC